MAKRIHIKMLCCELFEGRPYRDLNPDVVAWLSAASRRPDADHLYVHGSDSWFDQFREPNTQNGQLIFASKLIDRYRHNTVLQAEYYGRNLYLVSIDAKKPFNPYRDPEAKRIFSEALMSSQNRVWDAERKIEYGQLDYQDTWLVVPPAVAHGYDLFRVYEVSIQGDSFGFAHADMLTIVDRLEAHPVDPRATPRSHSLMRL